MEFTFLSRCPNQQSLHATIMGALRFSCIRETFHWLNIPCNGGKAEVEFITNNGQRISGEVIPMVILVADGMGEGSLGIMTTFCHHDQAMVEASKVLSTLHQHDSPELSVVVVRRFTNPPYLPQRSFGFLYLDITTLFGGASCVQFSLDQLHLHRLLPYSNTKVFLPWEVGEKGLKVYPSSRRPCGKAQRRSIAYPIQYYYQFPCHHPSPLRRRIPDGGRIYLSPGPTAFTKHQPGTSPAGMRVSPWSTGVG